MIFLMRDRKGKKRKRGKIRVLGEVERGTG